MESREGDTEPLLVEVESVLRLAVWLELLFNPVFSTPLSYLVNKQLADKERVAAALENTHLLEVVNQCLSARS